MVGRAEGQAAAIKSKSLDDPDSWSWATSKINDLDSEMAKLHAKLAEYQPFFSDFKLAALSQSDLRDLRSPSGTSTRTSSWPWSRTSSRCSMPCRVRQCRSSAWQMLLWALPRRLANRPSSSGPRLFLSVAVLLPRLCVCVDWNRLTSAGNCGKPTQGWSRGSGANSPIPGLSHDLECLRHQMLG